MAWQKNKILLISVETITDKDGVAKKVYHRYLVNKSKGKGKPNPGKMSIKKYNPVLKRHTVYNETKYK